jgi:hypothetical protein
MYTDVRPCDCTHDSQDQIYGRSKRLHNLTANGANCTVCGKKKTSGGYKKSDGDKANK